MGDEAFEEYRLVADTGTVVLRQVYGDSRWWLGLSKKRCEEDDPDVIIELTPRQAVTLAAFLDVPKGVS